MGKPQSWAVAAAKLMGNTDTCMSAIGCHDSTNCLKTCGILCVKKLWSVFLQLHDFMLVVYKHACMYVCTHNLMQKIVHLITKDEETNGRTLSRM